MAQETPAGNPYWEVLSPDELAGYDKALEATQIIISSQPRNTLTLVTNRQEYGAGVLTALIGHINRTLPDPWIFDSSIPRPTRAIMEPPMYPEKERGITID